MKSNRRWFNKLQIYFMVAIGASIIIAGIGTLILLKFIGETVYDYFTEDLSYNRENLDEALNIVEVMITKNGLKPENSNQILLAIEHYDEFNFSTFATSREEGVVKLFSDMSLTADAENIVATRYYENDYGRYVVLVESNKAVTVLVIVGLVMIIIYILLFTTTMSYLIGRKQRYLIEIAKGLERLAAGELSYKIPIRGKDEITSVARNTNYMSKTLKENIEKERFLEKSKSELIANISHDLRTPLTAITGFLTLLKENYNMNPEEAKTYIDISLKKSTDLSKLIEQLFEYVMLSNNQLIMDLKRVDMVLVMKQSCFECKSLLEEKGFTIEVFIEGIKTMVNIDSTKFMRVIDNLIQNISRYADKSVPIKIIAYQNDGMYLIQMSNGVPIDTPIIKDVFRRYFTSNRIEHSGSGLGLAICKEVIERHGGKIEAEISHKHFKVKMALPIIES